MKNNASSQESRSRQLGCVNEGSLEAWILQDDETRFKPTSVLGGFTTCAKPSAVQHSSCRGCKSSVLGSRILDGNCKLDSHPWFMLATWPPNRGLAERRGQCIMELCHTTSQPWSRRYNVIWCKDCGIRAASPLKLDDPQQLLCKAGLTL